MIETGTHSTVSTKDYKCGYRLVSKLEDEGFETDLYMKQCCTCTCTLCTAQYRHTGWIECCKVLASSVANFSRIK